MHRRNRRHRIMRCTDGDNAATYRPGQWRAGMDYDGAVWRDHSIRAARFQKRSICTQYA